MATSKNIFGNLGIKVPDERIEKLADKLGDVFIDFVYLAQEKEIDTALSELQKIYGDLSQDMLVVFAGFILENKDDFR